MARKNLGSRGSASSRRTHHKISQRPRFSDSTTNPRVPLDRSWCIKTTHLYQNATHRKMGKSEAVRRTASNSPFFSRLAWERPIRIPFFLRRMNRCNTYFSRCLQRITVVCLVHDPALQRPLSVPGPATSDASARGRPVRCRKLYATGAPNKMGQLD